MRRIDYKDKALHASLQFGESVILASDVFPGSSFSRGSGDTALSITLNDAEKAKKIFVQLAEGGEVMVHSISDSGARGMEISKTNTASGGW